MGCDGTFAGGSSGRSRPVAGPSPSLLRMNQRFKVVSLAHQKAPLAIREQLALDETACRRLLLILSQELALTNVLVLSTCNRTEVCYSAPQDHSDSIRAVSGFVYV